MEIHNYKDRILYADIIRILAILFVVIIHVSAYSMSIKDFGSRDWWVGHTINSLVRSGVTLFVMLSGMLLLSKDYKLSDFLKKRFIRVFIPYVVWSAIYILARYLFRGERFTPLQIVNIFTGFKAETHIWFIGVILGLYIVTPIIRIYVKNAEKGNILYFLLVWFIFTSIIPVIAIFTPIKEIYTKAEFATGFTGCYILGYFLSKQYFKRELMKYFIILFLLGYLLTIFLSYLSASKIIFGDGEHYLYFYDYLTPNVIMMALSLFILLKGINYKKYFDNRERLVKFIVNLSSSSFGVYLVQVLFIGLLDSGFFGLAPPINGLFDPIIEIPMNFIIVTFLSFLTVNLLKKIPVVRFIVP